MPVNPEEPFNTYRHGRVAAVAQCPGHGSAGRVMAMCRMWRGMLVVLMVATPLPVMADSFSPRLSGEGEPAYRELGRAIDDARQESAQPRPPGRADGLTLPGPREPSVSDRRVDQRGQALHRRLRDHVR